MSSRPSFFRQVNRGFDRAAALTNYDQTLLNQIKACNSVYHMSFPIKRDDGSIEVIDAWKGGAFTAQAPHQRWNTLQPHGERR